MIKINQWAYALHHHPVQSKTNLIIEKGDVVLLLGQNGSGKSSFFQTLFKIEKRKGEILYNDQKVEKLSAKDVSFLPQKYNRHHSLSIENMAVYSLYQFKNGNHSLLESERCALLSWLYFFKFKKDLSTSFSKLSGGEQQKVMLCLTYLSPAPLVILDEPTSNLDPGILKLFLESLEKLKGQGKSFLISTHDPYSMKQMSPKIWGIKNQIIGQCSWDEVETLYD